MVNPRLEALFQKFLGEDMTEPELRELQDVILSDNNTDDLDLLLQKAYTNPALAETGGYDADEIFAEIIRQAKAAPTINAEQPILVRKMKPFRWIAAASVVLLVSLGGYFIFKKKAVPEHEIAVFANDIAAPKANRASITLSNGKQVFLDSSANGVLASEGKTSIQKLAENQIVYNRSRENKKNNKESSDYGSNNKQPNTQIAYNTLTNPRGSRQISILLSDGTTVWLNAASSLKYPVAFSGNERKVEITGEAYFEVVHNAKQPFKVVIGLSRGEVEVLGTHFNINAYTDEQNIKTTLLEGSIKVSKENETKIITPGQQAVINPSNTNIEIKDGVDIEKTIAWKNNKFIFDRDDLPTIMRELERWYDVQVEYKYKGTTSGHFTGIISRNKDASQVLNMLMATGNIHFDIDGKKIIVLP